MPNILSAFNLSLGLFSILLTFNKEYALAAMMILIAAVIDRYDGRIARFFNVSSELGKELDSLSDLTSFGIAPAILICIKFDFFNNGSLGELGIVIVFLYVISGSFRLANYNINEFEGYFTGVPITVAGSILTFFTIFNFNAQILIAIILLMLFAYLMVSKIQLKKF
ncbi:CDP-alcohol phosphatidyltransferase family protein [Solibacillus sp. CAU 1738]